ncbi:MAG TPA: dicarboxylate/amino acid:cation symporter [Dokdonella sp.]|uniref:dicarboxylate/amino acid:cation symporter n=1 Tax=Dokdonella sp. TaxID=2291710 RepID=UPI002D7F19DF|nr:dicarboxylate/amino acid:cation symporter [Dokdonella sp.]HET9032805.1 dicarboxylate/amino acid:cation symporter [Dokdonella sp.]
MPLHTRMLIGFVVGLVGGILANLFAADSAWLETFIHYVSEPAGQIFLRLLFMLVVPLVFSALVLGVSEIGDIRTLGRIGKRTLLWIVLVTGIAVSIGYLMVTTFQPGRGLSPEVAAQMQVEHAEVVGTKLESAANISGVDMIVHIVPDNPLRSAVQGDLIGVMFFGLLVGIAIVVLRTDGTRTFLGMVQGLYDISILLIDWIIKLAPWAVAALLFTLTARLGYDVLAQLGSYVLVVAGGLAIHMFIVFPLLLKFLGKTSPLAFFKAARPAILTALSTSSSSATLPTTLMVAEENLGIPHYVGRFVCTLGATANMNGTALFEGVTVLFLAQFFGVELAFSQQIMILFLCVFGSIGAAGVPGGSLPVIAMIMTMFGIPAEGIGIILGVDRLLDALRTTINVTGDLAGSMVIARFEDPDHAAAIPVAGS